MADTDVVKRDLAALSPGLPVNWEEYKEPVPFPDINPHSPLKPSPAFLPPPVTTRVSSKELVTAPYRSIGRMGMNFVLHGKTLKVTATGWVVAKRAFVTAGHSVYREIYGGWITWAGFAPRYNRRVDTAFGVESVYTLKGWVDSGEPRYDLAACVITGEFADTEPPLVFSNSDLPPLSVTAIGYPARPSGQFNFNGERMWKCIGEFVRDEDGMRIAANNLTEGSSGGPWGDTVDNSEIVGLTSTRDEEHFEQPISKSPFFAQGFQNLYDAVKDL